MSYYTFLPRTDKQKMRREYRIRALIVAIFFIAVSIVVGVTALFPAYVYSTLEEKLHLSQVATIQKSTDIASVNAIQKQLSISKNLVDTLNSTIQTNFFSNAIKSIVAIRGTIQINSFLVENSANSLSVTISGIAPTRADLLAFKSRLQELSPLTPVNLPYSVLAMDKNVSFSIQVTETLK